jgi:cysteine desulfurase/selenocysteine lyase
VVHLAAGGETPPLRSHQEAVDRFWADKALGEASRARLEEVYHRCKGRAAQLLGTTADQIALLSSSSEGINMVAHALEWRPGDNVVLADVEFPSDVLPWTRLMGQGVEIRIARHRGWAVNMEDIAAVVDERTRVLAISQVSYFTGQRLSLAALSKLARDNQALLVVDATHSAGVVQVEASLADILVTSCYKWLLGVHGVAIFYWNRRRLPDLEPPFLGWNSGVTIPSWRTPTEVTLRPDADRFLPGNPSFISIYVLDNALELILKVGVPAIGEHALALSGQVWEGLAAGGWEMMTPGGDENRAGNVCFIAPDVDRITAALAQRGILVWGSYAGVNRVRVSTHLYNDSTDVERFLSALSTI